MNKSTVLRQKTILDAAIGSTRLEGLHPSKADVSRLEKYVKGDVTIEQIRSENLQKITKLKKAQ